MAHDIPKILERLGIAAKRNGKEWCALCPSPDHDDKSPSWNIRDEPGSKKHGLFRCWPCGFSGDVYSLVMKLKGVGFKEAKEWVGSSDVDDKPVPVTAVVTSSARVGFQVPSEVRFGPLAKWVTPAREYVSERRITGEQVEKWGIGYATGGRLAGRIVVPYRDAGGRPRGYTARTFVGDRKRYLEPDLRERADRSTMFGEQHWPKPADGWEEVFVTEGALNALAIERVVLGAYVAALAGSQPHPAHVAKIARFKNVFIVTDPDPAGDKAGAILEGVLRAHVGYVARVGLPRGKDAADIPAEDLKGLLEARYG